MRRETGSSARQHVSYNTTVNVLKFQTFLVSNKILVIRVEIHVMLVRIQTGKTLIRLLLQKQSDLGLPCLSRPFWQATSVGNLRISTVRYKQHNMKIFLMFLKCRGADQPAQMCTLFFMIPLNLMYFSLYKKIYNFSLNLHFHENRMVGKLIYKRI